MRKHSGLALAGLASLAAITSPTLAAAQAPPPMSAADLITMPRLGAPVVTPGGRFAVYPITKTDPETFDRAATHYLQDLDQPQSAAIPLALGEDVHSASFGSDNFLYFLSSRGVDASGDEAPERSRLWRAALEADGNVTGPMLVADLVTSIEGYALSPTGDAVAIWAPIDRDCERFGCEGDGTAHLPGPGDGRLYDGSAGFFRHWDTWSTPGTFSRVFVVGLEDGAATGDPVALDGPAGPDALVGDTPTKPFGGSEDIAWAADGKSVFFTVRQSGADEPLSTNLDIYQSDLSGAAPRNLTQANLAYDALPTPSPDGTMLAYVAMERAGYESDRLVVHLRDLATGETRALTDGFDRSFHSLAWTPDSRWIVATAQDVLDTPAFRIDPRSGAVERLDLMAGNEAHLGNVMPLPGNRLMFTRDSIGGPSDLYLSQGWAQAKPLTGIAAANLGNHASIMTERFSFAGANGDTVWGQITKPERFDGSVPAILYIHGGPQGSFNDGWSSRWNPRVLASQGYAVISVDFHGSTGYGQAFTDAINKDWGGKPLADLKLGLAAALARDPQIDGERACAMGASYGGYMVNWIAGNWPDRFDCLIQHDGLFDMRSFYYATEELWFPRWDFGGSYAENPELYERWNPVNFVDNWKTPMLVVAGEKDFRVPYTQGLQSFTALKERGIPSQLLVFPNENHWVLSAKNSLQWHQTVFAWLDRWLKADEKAEEAVGGADGE